MGSMISLGVGRLELDWGKNNYFRNHSALFLPSDVRDADYYYADDIVETKRAYVRSLRSVVRRLEMLGYCLHDCERMFNSERDSMPEWYSTPVVTFDEFARALRTVDVDAFALPDAGDYDLGEFAARAILSDPEFAETEPKLAQLSKDDGTFFENLDPYVTLRLLGENPRSEEADVVWRFADVVDGGWVAENEIYEGPAEADRCLVVTEGSTDRDILSSALPIVAPDVADFFHFVDMAENYPFTGTGNLFRFCQGLSRIRVQNRILVVLDNDTAGRDAYCRISSLDLPPRMRATVLPPSDDFRCVSTLGPSGRQSADINGRAVSIECFLDIWSNIAEPPVVRWTSFNAGMDAYQGELVNADALVQAFHEAVKRRDNAYDFSRLKALWSHLVQVCTGESALERPPSLRPSPS